MVLVLGRKAILRALVCVLNIMSIIRYMFVFWLKNPAAFKDDFFYVFINTWILGACFLYQFSVLPFQYQNYPVYHVCVGQQPQELNSLVHKQIRFPLMITLLLHLIVCIRLFIFNRKSSAVSQESTCSSKMIFLKELENQFIVTFVDDLIYVILFAIFLKFNDFLEQIHEAKDWTTISISMLISPPLIQLISFVGIYLKNKRLRTFFLRSVSECIEAAKEDLSNLRCYDVT